MSGIFLDFKLSLFWKTAVLVVFAYAGRVLSAKLLGMDGFIGGERIAS